MGDKWMGYRRANGKCGARNLVAVIPSIVCANDVAQAIVRQVQGTVGYFHHQGCCQLPIDLKRVTDTLSALGQSPNVGAALVVSLGCEGTDHERLVEHHAYRVTEVIAYNLAFAVECDRCGIACINECLLL